MFGFAAASISNVYALQRCGTSLVDIWYDLSVDEGTSTSVSTELIGGWGEVKMLSLSGDIGAVKSGIHRHIVWDAGADNAECVQSNLRIAVNVKVSFPINAINDKGMEWMPRRDSPPQVIIYGYLADYYGYSSSTPMYGSCVGGFYIDRYPISKGLWKKVSDWALQHGYRFEYNYDSSWDWESSYPAILVTSDDACIWCNARSEMEGLPLCYRDSYGSAYKRWGDGTSHKEIKNGGYRLPEAYELASVLSAQGLGMHGQRKGLVTRQGTPIGYIYSCSTSDSSLFQMVLQYWSNAPLYCVRDPQDGVLPPDITLANYSNNFEIDTRVSSPTFPKDFKIIDIKSKYCDGKYGSGNKALFLSGVHVHCNVEFEVDVYGGDLAYLERVNGEEIQLELGKFTLDVGALAPGESFEVRARSSDGRWSQNFKLNFDVAAQKGATWTASPGKNSIQYRTIELDSFQLFDQLSDNQADPLEAQKSKLVSNLVNKFYKYPHELQIGVNVCWTMDSSEGIIRGVALFGAQESTTDDDATFKKKVAEIKAKGGKQALKFGSVTGYIKAGVENTWSWDTNSLGWQEHGNYVAVNVGANGCFVKNWFPTPIPWYYSADGGIDVYLRARIANGGLQYAINTDKLLYVTLRIGIGVPSVLSIEGSGTGSIFLTYDTETDPNLQRLGMALALALKAHMVGFVIPILDWTGEWYWIGGENEFADIDISSLVDKAMSNAVTNSANELSREYTNNWNNASSTSGNSQYSGFTNGTIVNQYPTSTSGPAVDIEDDNSGMPGPNSQAPGDTPPRSNGGSCESGSEGNGGGNGTGGKINFPTKIVVVADDTRRSSNNRATIITVSDTTNATFTTEGAVWDDGTPDYNPTTARMTNGCSVVAWMNKREGGTENVTLGEMMSEMEIAVAVWNDETGEWSHQNLTDNGAYDRLPILKTATNGTAAVTWIRNAYTNYIGSASKPNQVCFARYVDGAWTTESIVVPSVGRVRKLDMAYDGVHAAIVFNEEDDPGNGTTQRLYVVTGDCSTWEPFRVVAESPVNNSAAYAYYDEVGGLRLVWNDEGTIKTGLYANGTLTAETIDTDGHQIPGDYVFTRAHSGCMALVWLEQMKETDSAMGPVSMTYNPAKGVWTLPCALTSDGKNKTEVSAAFNDAGDLEVFYSTPKTATNEQGFVETVSSGFSKVTRRHGGDVAILAEDVSFSTNVFTMGETVDVTFKVKNLGDETISNVTIRVQDRSNGSAYLTNIVCMSELLEGQALTISRLYSRINELKAGQCLVLKVSWSIPTTVSSQFTLYFYASGTGDVLSKNNSFTWAHGNADVSLVQAQSRTDEISRNVRHVSVSLKNNGLAAVPTGTEVTFRRGSAQGQVLARKTVGKVLAGEDDTQATGFEWDISSFVPTSNVEMVHVTAELPESAVVEQRTLEVEIPVDVSPIVKSSLTAYSLVYDANGGTGTMSAEQPFYDEWGPLASNTFTRAGYTFAGWALSSTGDVAYADGAIHCNVPMYARDAATLYAVWNRLAEETTTTDVPIPFSWLGAYYPEATNSTDSLDQQIANFESIANRPTGKRDGSGNPLSVWHDYVAGTVPTNSEDVFRASITIDKDTNEPVVEWMPKLSTEEAARRVYRKYGKEKLTDDWTLIDGNAANYHFFKVTVEMK